MTFSSQFNSTLGSDTVAIQSYINAVNNGSTTTQAFEMHMRGASTAAQTYVQSMNFATLSTDAYVQQAKMAEIATMAQNKSFTSVRSILNTYNTGLSEVGLSSQQFTQSVAQGNSVLGRYLANVGVGNATMRGYVGTLIAAKAATIGLRIAQTVLNAAITMGISVIISSGISLISDLIHHEEKLIEKSEEAASSIQTISDNYKSASKTVSDIGKKFAELSQGIDQTTGENVSLSTDEYSEFLDMSKQLAEVFPTLSKHYDENGNAIVELSGDVNTITGSLESLLKAERKLANQKIIDNVPNLYSGIKAKSDNYISEIEGYETQKEEIQSFVNKLSSDNFENSFDKIIVGNTLSIEGEGKSLEELNNITDDYLKVLDELGIKYSYLSTEFETNGSTKGYYYQILGWEGLSEEEVQAQKDKIKIGLREIAKTYQNKIDDLDAKIKLKTAENKANWSGLLSSLFTWMSEDSSYSNLNDKSQSIAQKIINSLDFSKLNFKSFEKAQEYIRDNVFGALLGNNSETVGGIISLNEAFSNSEITLEEYKNKIQELIGKLKLDDKQKEALSAILGYDFEANKSYTEKSEDFVRGKLKDDDKHLVGTLTSEELQIAKDISATDMGVKTGELVTWETLYAKILQVKKAKDAASKKSISDELSGVQKLSSGLEQLSKIYADIKDGGNFDYGSIFNNQDFSDTFSKYTKEYNNFLNTVAKSPGNIKACQSAFDKLVSAYIDGSGALDNLTESSRDTAVAMLEQMGITNAAKIVDAKLARQKERVRVESELGADATWESCVQMANEAGQSQATQQALLDLALEKIRLNSNAIKTADDIQNLIDLAAQCGATAESIQNLNKAKIAKGHLDELNKISDPRGKSAYAMQYGGVEKLEKDIKNGTKKVSYEKYKGNYTFKGGNANSSGSKSSGGSSSKSSKSEKKAIDWIEIKIKRITDAISKLKDKASNTYRTLKARTADYNKEISKTISGISTQEKAAKKYSSAAKKVKLSSKLKKKVRDGSISIGKYSESTQEKINQYKDYYEKALEAEKAAKDLKKDLSAIYVEIFDAISANYEDKLKAFEHTSKMYETAQSTLEAKGYLASSKSYSLLLTNSKKRITMLKDEAKSLETALTDAVEKGDIKKYSEEWYDMVANIDGVNESIADTEKEVAELQKSLRETNWEYFDYTQERIKGIVTEADFLIDLLSDEKLYDDNGKITDKGIATLALRNQNYETYAEQAKMYAKEIASLDEEIAKDPNNTDLIKRREELLGLQQDSITSAQKEKQAIKSLVEDGIKTQLNSLKELIDTYKESLSSAKDLHDYQKNVLDKTSEISKLQKQLSVYETDTSEEAKAKIQKLKVELESAKDDLKETEYDRYISEQEKLLDDLYDEYEDNLNKRLDNIDSLIERVITVIGNNPTAIKDAISEIADKAGYTLSENIVKILNGGTVKDTVSGIESNTENMVNQSNKTASKTNSTPRSKKVSYYKKYTGKSKSFLVALGKSGGEYATKNIKKVAELNGIKSYSPTSKTQNAYLLGLLKNGKLKKYKTGGIVDYTGLAQVDGTPSKPELMLNAKDTQNFIALKDYLRKLSSVPLTTSQLNNFNPIPLQGIEDMSKTLNKLKEISACQNSSNGNTVTFGDTVINVGNVRDYDDFVRKLRDDRSFEKMIQAMTIDQAVGRSSFSKYKYFK